MSDLDFSRNVPDVPASSGPAVPAPYHRTETVQPVHMPDFQGAMTNYAADTNWMSFIGSQVAAKASDAVAQKIGGEMGKNPKGDLGPSFTDFDKTMKNSYNTQAQATLGLQANKLINDSYVTTASATRVTPDLIAKTNQSVQKGLQNILKNAPDDIKPHMEMQFGNAMLQQSSELSTRMIREQKEDQKNNNALASDMNTQHAYSFGLNGNDKAGLAAVENTKRLNEASVASRLITPEAAKANIDSARQSYLSGKQINQYEKARAAGKGEEYLKSIADKKPSDLSDSDYMAVTNNLMQYVNHQDALRSQNQSLALAKFQTSVAMNPMAPNITQQLNDLKANVSPEAYEKAQLHYVNAVKNWNTEQGNVNNALASWNDPSSFARLTEKGVNKAFDMQVSRYVQQREQQGSPISNDEAEVQVAASAGGKVPVFQNALENKLLSGSPAAIASAANQMDMLDRMEQGRVYAGVSQKAKAVATLFNQQRGSMPDNDLARQITDNLSNVDEKTQKTLDNSWNLILSAKGAGGMGATKSLTDFALQQVNLDKDKLGGTYFGVIYGNDIYNQLNSNFIATRGDFAAAKKMTQDYVDQHYGDTYVNGFQQKTDSPIEKYLGYKGKEITPFVQNDLLNQLGTSFAQAKKDHPTDYWETVPMKKGMLSSTAPEIARHVNGKEYRYPVELVGRAGNQWDVVVKTPTGQRSLFLVAPHLGVTTYQPNKEAIEKDFKANKPKGWFTHG